MTADGTEGDALSVQEAAQRLGVHYMTLYRYVRTGRLPARRRGRQWLVAERDLARLSTVEHPSSSDSWEERSERLLLRLLAGDAGGCWSIVENALLSGTPADAYVRLMAPAMRRLGDMWAAGDVTVGDEHRASAVALGLSGRLGPLFSRRGRAAAGPVLVGGAEDDPHILPGRMVADVMRSQGVAVADLGAAVPARSFAEAAAEIPDLRAVGVSVSVTELVPAVTRTVEAVHRTRPGVPVLAGGPALGSAAEARRAGADLWAPDALAAASLVAALAAAGEPFDARDSR